MPHTEAVHPITQIRKECDNIAYLAGKIPGIGARLRFLLNHLDALEAERTTLKQSWKAKHQQANMLTLRVAYLERMLELANEHNLIYRERMTRMSVAPPPVWRDS